MTFASTPRGCIKGRRNAFSDYTSDISNEVAENVSPSSYQPEFEQGLDFILNHFEEPLFPKTISTKMTLKFSCFYKESGMILPFLVFEIIMVL
jgi:hypothetical protein